MIQYARKKDMENVDICTVEETITAKTVYHVLGFGKEKL